jgi:16S rRNA C967 or C1407 C5-methylase (RsmB/RsmF family)/NOL1/NOP2/fmu family ribosome biogenesis protein
MLPEEFILRLNSQEYINCKNLLTALEEPSPVSIRINPSKWNRRPINADPVPWCETGFYLDKRPSYTLDPLFHSGCYYPQEASGMFLEKALRQTAGSLKNIRVLDLCGAPGGKSTHLSDIIGQDSLLVANEVIRSRSGILSETITKWGSVNTLVTQNDPSEFGRLPGYFDIILVDAPCSGEGMFRSNVAINEWSVDNSSHCSERQKRILMHIWPSLKENGILIYSTCTFNPGENEENIKWLIGNHKAESVQIDIAGIKGISEIDLEGIYGYGFYPDKIRGEGLFISVIRKTGKQDKTPIRNQRISELRPGKSDLEVANEWTNFSKDRLIRWRDEIIAVPCGMDEYIHLFQNLKVVKAGTKIFAVKRNNFLPSHEIALSFQLKKEAFHREGLNLQGAVSYLRRDNLTLPAMLKGWNIVTYKDINLGFVNNIGNRVNNYFPVEWRIRLDASTLCKTKPIVWQ